MTVLVFAVNAPVISVVSSLFDEQTGTHNKIRQKV